MPIHQYITAISLVALSACGSSATSSKQNCAASLKTLFVDDEAPPVESLFGFVEADTWASEIYTVPPEEWKFGNSVRCSLKVGLAAQDGEYSLRIEGDSGCTSRIAHGAQKGTAFVWKENGYVSIPFLNSYPEITKKALAVLRPFNALLSEMEFVDHIKDDDSYFNFAIEAKDTNDNAFLEKLCSNGLFGDLTVYDPTPSDCVFTLNRQWFDFKVDPAFVSKNKALLDELVEATKKRDAALEAKAKLDKDVATLLAQKKAWDALIPTARKWTRFKYLRDAALNHQDCAGDTNCQAVEVEKAKLWGEYFEPENKAFSDSLLDSGFASEKVDLVVAEYDKRKAAVFSQYDDVKKGLQDIMALRQKHKAKLLVSGQHMTTAKPEKGKVAFKEVPLFPADPSKVMELGGIKAKLEGDLLKVTFDGTGANLRNEFQSGTAITLFGFDVGYLDVRSPNSEGASLLPLPKRTVKKKEPEPAKTDTAECPK